jgi:hypothetical protein
MEKLIKTYVGKGFHSILAISALILGLLFSCQAKEAVVTPPEGLLTNEEFTDVMEDLFMIEGLRSMHTSAEHKQLNPTEAYYNALWEEQNIEKQRFLNSFDYYSKDRLYMEKVYAEIAKRLKIEEDKIKSASTEPRAVDQESKGR